MRAVARDRVARDLTLCIRARQFRRLTQNALETADARRTSAGNKSLLVFQKRTKDSSFSEEKEAKRL
jgi:hypothetical protein